MSVNPSDPKRPLSEHVAELSIRLKRVLLYLFVACALGYALNTYLIEWILGPLKSNLPEGASLVYTRPFEKIWVYMRVSLYFGVLFASPFCLLEVFHFVSPVFARRRLGYQFVCLILGSAVAFTVGIYFGKAIALPAILRAVFSFASDGVLPFFTLSAYVSAAAGVLLACAVLLEIPVLMFFLGLWGFVGASVWRKARRPAIVINAVLSAFLSPPDPLSMFVVLIPLLVVFEGGLLLAALGEKLGKLEQQTEVEVM